MRRALNLIYAFGFTAVLPLALAAWAWRSPLAQGLPMPPPAAGVPIAAAGLGLWLWAVATFVRGARKLPLNADPPDIAVASGPYALLSDPIYVGFGLAVAGLSIVAGAPAGLWIVSPVVALAMLSLVAGYENLHRPARTSAPLLALPTPGQPRRRRAVKGLAAAAAVGLVLFAGGPWPGWPGAGVIAAGLLAFAWAAPGLHAWAVACATAVANSWSALRLGPVRILSYAPIAAAAAGLGTVAFSLLLPGDSAVAAAVLAASVLIGAGLWGRLLESTGRLARPFGYFGAFLGGVGGTIAVSVVLGLPLVQIGAALAFAAACIQAIGRLRCLIQGCCHGRPVTTGDGIVYRAPESRAVAVAGLGGRALYPTPVFSIYANLLSAALMLRLFLTGASSAAILAVYLIGAGLSRFAEEGYRGEADVRRYRGLTVYQWLAVGQLLAGVAFTLAGADALVATRGLTVGEVAVAAVAAALFGFAMGVDFPDADVPFARLTPQRAAAPGPGA